MAERLVFLTGHLARARLERLLAGLGETEFAWEIVDIGVKVAALMTEEIIKRRLKLDRDADRVILPGRYRGDLERLSAHFGVPFVRGPDEIADLPAFLGRAGEPPDLSRHDMRIFAEIVDAPMLSIDALVAQGARARRGRRRRHRPRLPAGDAVSAARRGGAGTEGRGLFRQRRFRQPRRTRDRRAGRRGLSAQPRREHAAAGLRSQGDAGADPVGSRRSRFARARHRGGRSAPASPSSPILSSTRSISASPSRSAASSRRAAAGRRSNC